VGAMGSGAESGTSITQASVPILTQPYVRRDYSSGQEVVDARAIEPGPALANAQTLTGAIVESKG